MNLVKMMNRKSLHRTGRRVFAANGTPEASEKHHLSHDILYGKKMISKKIEKKDRPRSVQDLLTLRVLLLQIRLLPRSAK